MESQYHYNFNDIPNANSDRDEREPSVEKVDQHKAIKDAVTQITKSKPSVNLLFKESFSKELIDILKKKGYRVKYYEFYDSSDDVCSTRVIISNPAFAGPTEDFFEKLEKQFRDVGFGGNISMNGDAKDLFNSFFKNLC